MIINQFNTDPTLLNLNERHHAWHTAGGAHGHPGRRIPMGQPGSGIEFFQFHRDLIYEFFAWNERNGFVIPVNQVTPWQTAPVFMQNDASWGTYQGAYNRIVNNSPAFSSEDQLGIFVETGIHNGFLHGATSRWLRSQGQTAEADIINSFHSPESSFFYQIHGMVDWWWHRYQAIKQVPGWFGWHNQGGDIAMWDINGNGRPDLVVMHIDNPSRDNAAYYRIGWNLDANGNAAGGWTAPRRIPGWFGWENQGGGIALADINGNGRPDLVVLHLDNPQNDNAGYYRIGWNMNTNGNISSWSNPIRIPGWFGWENQGAGVAIFDISGNGRPDIIVFHIDNPGQENGGYYRIGWNLDVNGNVTGGWSNPVRVPGWWGWENQGAGIAVRNVSGGARPELVVFHIDNPSRDNMGYYRIGRELDTNGNVTGGWSEPIRINGWWGWENQGGGIALWDMDGNGRQDLIAMHLDNPQNDNHAYYRIVRNI